MGPPRIRGFTLLELVVVICLVGIFASVALDRLLRYQEIAEKTAMEASIAAMRTGLTIQVAARVARGGLSALKGLEQENPMDWLSKPPAGYVGALYAPTDSTLPPGGWCFDLQNKEIVYRPERTRYFSPSGEDDFIRYRVLVRLGVDAKSGLGELSELDIRPARPIRWVPEF